MNTKTSGFLVAKTQERLSGKPLAALINVATNPQRGMYIRLAALNLISEWEHNSLEDVDSTLGVLVVYRCDPLYCEVKSLRRELNDMEWRVITWIQSPYYPCGFMEVA